MGHIGHHKPCPRPFSYTDDLVCKFTIVSNRYEIDLDGCVLVEVT